MKRAVFVYLFAVVVPALMLLGLSFQSVQRQQRAIASLAQTNQVLAAEKLAAAVREEEQRLARECLSSRSCSFARYFFSLENGELIDPRVQDPPAREPAGLPEQFRRAEADEFAPDRLAVAVEGYQSVHAMAVPPEVKALAASRVARCFRKLKRDSEANAMWSVIRDRYGALYDPLHRPYSILARFELGQVSGLFEELVAGKWNISAEQFEHWVHLLERELPKDSRYALARELDEHFRAAQPVREGEIYSYALPTRRVFYQNETADRIVGITVDRQWVEGKLIPHLRAKLNLPDEQQSEPGNEMLLYGGTTTAVIVVLLLGIVFVVRDARREVRMSHMRSEFVSGISHELKTPLTVIRLYGETLLRGDFPEAERRGFYEIITRESERLSQLIQKVLSFSRIDQGEKLYTLSEGDLAGAVHEVLQHYRKHAERAGFALTADVQDGLPAVRFDADAVSQAVVNLLDNALKYSGKSNTIAVRLREHSGTAVLEVEDQGLGISADDRKRIFDKFYRASNSSGKGGYGLGLYLVRHIMEAHAGRVEVDSEPGKGSRFRLVFPAVA